MMPGVKIDAAIISYYSVCQNCGVIFQNPRLTDKELSKYYKEGYYRRSIDSKVEEMDKNELLRAEVDTQIIKKYKDTINSHLDLGCSRGYLLEKVGAKIKIGVEENIKYVEIKKVEVYPDIKDIPNKTFDLVTAIHLLEHVPHPLEYLKTIRKFLSTDGLLILEVPTWKSPGGPLRLAHLFHFEPDVLRKLCRQAGLDPIDVEFTPHLMLICKLVK